MGCKKEKYDLPLHQFEEDITLEDSFRTYQEGMKLLRYCDAKIDKVEKQVMMINEDGGLDEF